MADDYDDLEEVIATEPVIYSSRRLTDQQRLRLASPTSVNLTIINEHTLLKAVLVLVPCTFVPVCTFVPQKSVRYNQPVEPGTNLLNMT